jgi:hypothetical protein
MSIRRGLFLHENWQNISQRCTYPDINTTNGCDIIKLIDALFLEGSRCLLLFADEKREICLGLSKKCKYSIAV